MTLRVFLLGPMRAFDGDSPIRLPPRSRLVSLWGYLLVHRRRPTPRALLAYTLWPDEAEAEARQNLRRHLHRLQQLLPSTGGEPWILTDSSTLQWNLSAEAWLDLAAFEDLSADADRLPEAVELHGGDLLEGIYDDWVFAERERLREICFHDLHRLVDRLEQRGDYREAIRHAQRLLRLDPLREETYRSLMRLAARSGDRASVVQTYKACSTVLERELNLEPAPETRRAYEEALAEPAAEPVTGVPVPEPMAARHNLPTPLTSFVGRERESAELKSLLGRGRLVTLTGIGGVGKTRLALAVARDGLPHFTDGVWWIDLAPLVDPSLVPQAVASAVGLREQSTRPIAAALAEALRPRQTLLVLDNCEHVVGACTRLVADILATAPEVRFLATSTEPLDVPGEVVWPVPPLELPPAGDSAVESEAEEAPSLRLFVDRAVTALPTFRLTPSNRPSVNRLCRALDGIPLALELAAARLKMLSVEQLVERLDDRFRLLTGGSRSALPRHRTLRAVLDWSHDLLSPGEQALFRRLSLFVGGFTLESAESVCAGDPIGGGEILEILSELVDKSLVMVSRADPARVRYGMLETVGHYARERLIEAGEADRIRALYTGRYVGLIDEAGEKLLRGPDQEAWFSIVEHEYDNLRGLLSYGEAAGDLETLARIAPRLWPFWWTHGYVAEGRRWLDSLVSRREGLPLDLEAAALHAAGRLMILQGDFAQAATVLEENLSVVRRMEDRPAEANALSSLGMVFSHLQDYDRAEQIWRHALEVYRSQDDKWGVARAMNNLGDLLIYRGDYAAAVERLEQSVALFRELQSTLGESIGLINLGRAALQLGESSRAAGLFRESLRLKVALNDKEGIAWNLEGLAGVAALEGDPERAARLFGAADALRKSIGIPLSPADLPLHERNLDRSRRQASPSAWEACWADGAAMDTQQAIDLALSGDR